MKRTARHFLRAVCFCLMLSFVLSAAMLSSTAALPAEADRVAKGMTFVSADSYDTVKGLSSLPFTYEVLIQLPTSVNGRAGTIFGNYDDGRASTNVDVSNGNPRMYYYDGKKNNFYITFNQVDVRSDTDYVHVAMTFDEPTRTAYCYVNGELKQTLTDVSQPICRMFCAFE